MFVRLGRFHFGADRLFLFCHKWVGGRNRERLEEFLKSKTILAQEFPASLATFLSYFSNPPTGP